MLQLPRFQELCRQAAHLGLRVELTASAELHKPCPGVEWRDLKAVVLTDCDGNPVHTRPIQGQHPDQIDGAAAWLMRDLAAAA